MRVPVPVAVKLAPMNSRTSGVSFAQSYFSVPVKFTSCVVVIFAERALRVEREPGRSTFATASVTASAESV